MLYEVKMSDLCFPLQRSPRLSQIKATCRFSAISAEASALPQVFLFSFDLDNPLTNDAHDAVLSRGHHPGKTPFQPEL